MKGLFIITLLRSEAGIALFGNGERLNEDRYHSRAWMLLSGRSVLNGVGTKAAKLTLSK